MSKGTCCGELAAYEIKQGAPVIIKAKSTMSSLISITFDQAMKFDEDWVVKANESKSSTKPQLTLEYKNGFKGTSDESKNSLVSWEIISASEEVLQI